MKIKRRIFYLAGVFLLVGLSGCGDPVAEMKKFTPPADEAIATNYIAMLRQSNYDPILKDIDPSLKSTFTPELLLKMSKAIPEQAPITVKVIGARQSSNSDVYRINLTFEYQFPTQWLLINVATQKKGGVSTIIGFHVQPLSDSLENYNKFTMAGKSPLAYGVIGVAILIPLFILYALVLCIRTKMEKRKWLWIIFILIGVGQFTMNWTTGSWRIAPLYIQLFGVGAFAPPFGAWLISISVPVGAICFLVKRKKLVFPVASSANLQIDRNH